MLVGGGGVAEFVTINARRGRDVAEFVSDNWCWWGGGDVAESVRISATC